MSEYIYCAYCNICNERVKWQPDSNTAKRDREKHFESEHPDNPMIKQNCVIQRHPYDEKLTND